MPGWGADEEYSQSFEILGLDIIHFFDNSPNRFTNHLGDHGGIAEIGIVEHQSFCHGKFLSLVK